MSFKASTEASGVSNPDHSHTLAPYNGRVGRAGMMAWESFDLMRDKSKLPIVECCYALYFNGELKYIGSTYNLRNRFSGHSIRYGYAKDIITPWGDFADSTEIAIKYKKTRKYGYYLMLEARLVHRIQPEFNKKLKGRSRALLPV